MQNNIETYLLLFDIHEEDKSLPAINLVEQVCKDCDFNKIVFGGD
jgi:hypothetical protein